MFKQKTTTPVKASTQSFIDVEEILEDLVLLRDFSVSCVIEVGAVNFSLLGNDEQVALIESYAGLLNSLSFPVQVLILSKKIDVSSYFEHLDKKIQSQKNEILRKRLESYKEFIKSMVKRNTVLEKRYYFVVPFTPLELGIASANKKTINREYLVSRAKTSLYPKRDHLLRLLAKMGLKASVLQKQQLIELFYNLYNPSSTGRKLASVESYTETVMTKQNV